MVSKKSCEIINNLNIPMLIYEYQTEHTCISAHISPYLSHGDNWDIRFSIPCQDPYDNYRLKEIRICKEINPIEDELFLEKQVRGWIEELLDYADKVIKKEVRIGNLY